MNKKELSRFTERLLAEKARILNMPGRIRKEELQLSTDDLADEADLASSGLSQSMNIRLRDRETLLLRKIEEALSKIERGEFISPKPSELVMLIRSEIPNVSLPAIHDPNGQLDRCAGPAVDSQTGEGRKLGWFDAYP